MSWRPAASLATLRLRAELLAETRAFFADRNVLEVDTPALSVAATTEPAIASFVTDYNGPGGERRLYLHSSPELAMKRLLAAGSGSIYQLAKVFRNGEAGVRHNPEFTLLEWYRVGFDHHQLMAEVDDLVRRLLGDRLLLRRTEKLSYRALFDRYLGFDPLAASGPELAARAATCGLPAPPGLDPERPQPWLNLLLTHVIEPQLPAGPLFVYDYPADQAALAKLRRTPGEPPLAERFELYLCGVELANGFNELTDAEEQRRRFAAENARREAEGLTAVPVDQRFLAALDNVPPTAGVALGVDRLVQLAAGANAIAEVIAFPFDRA